MELRSGRRLRSLPTPRPRRTRRPPVFPDGDGSDRFTALPDEMLLEILARLRCARAAADTSGLSRRWRGLWKHLLELSFRDMPADAAVAALGQVAGQVAGQALSFLEVDIPYKHRVPEPARVSALLHAAARLAPADLFFRLYGDCKDGNFPFEIPCFERATSVKLDMVGLYLIPPAGAVEFPLLEKLSVVCCRVDTAELVRRCPRLRVFKIEVYPSEDVAANRIKVHSPTIEDLAVVVKVVGVQLDSLDIMAPVLKRFSLRVNVAEDFTVSFSAPMVENIMWDCLCDEQNVGFGEKWRLHNLKLVMKEDVGVLRMHIFSEGELLPDRTFSQEIAQLPAFSVLKLHLQSKNHGIGALVSHLLGVCSSIRRLKVDIGQYYVCSECSPNCPCDQPQNWRNEIISLTALEEVKLTGLDGTENDVDLLKLLFRCAPLMKSMTVVLAPDSSLPTDQDCEEIYSMFEANPHVKCSVDRSPP